MRSNFMNEAGGYRTTHTWPLMPAPGGLNLGSSELQTKPGAAPDSRIMTRARWRKSHLMNERGTQLLSSLNLVYHGSIVSNFRFILSRGSVIKFCLSYFSCNRGSLRSNWKSFTARCKEACKLRCLWNFVRIKRWPWKFNNLAYHDSEIMLINH